MNGLIELGEYEGTRIDARDDEFVNATQMCKAAGKLWGHYQENHATQEFLDELAAQMRYRISDIVIVVKGGKGAQGTWVHKRVAIHLAQWCSPKFAVWVTGQIESILGGRQVAHREHAEARFAGLGAEIARGISAGLRDTNRKMDAVAGNVSELDDRVQSLEHTVSGIVPRRQISAATRRRHDFAVEKLGGLCPCCSQVIVIDQNGNANVSGEYDHFYMRSKAAVHETWLVCNTCNSRLDKEEGFKPKANAFFNNYQQRRELIEQARQPMLPRLITSAQGEASTR